MSISSPLPPETEHVDCTFTAVQIGRAGRAPFPSLQAAGGQGARPATAVQLQTTASALLRGWGRNQGSKLPLLVWRNQYLAIKPGEACLGITA